MASASSLEDLNEDKRWSEEMSAMPPHSTSIDRETTRMVLKRFSCEEILEKVVSFSGRLNLRTLGGRSLLLWLTQCSLWMNSGKEAAEKGCLLGRGVDAG